MLQDKLTKKAPYSQYPKLEEKGVQVAWGDPADPSSAPDTSFDVLYDNNGKDMEACQALIDKFKVIHGSPRDTLAHSSQLCCSWAGTLAGTLNIAVLPFCAGQCKALCLCGLCWRLQGQRD